MNRSKWIRYAMFGLIYFAEGTILSYFTALNPIYLRSFNLTMSQVGLMGTIAITPFIIKIFFGMLSDKVNFFKLGHRKPYIIIGLLVQGLCLLIVPAINPGEQFGLFALLAFVLMAGQALYDTCTDGLALDTTPAEEEGTIQGFMVGGRALGVVIISAVLGLLVRNLSWTVMFYALALLTLLPLPFVLMVKEERRRSDQRFEWKAFSAFKAWPVIALGLLGALYSLIINGADQIITPFMNETFAVDEFAAGLYVSVWGVGVMIGGLTGGKLVDRMGHRRSILVAAGISLLAIGSLALINGAAVAWGLMVLFGVAYGYYETVYFAVSMNYTDSRIAASMFSILMAVANLGTAVGLGLSGALVDLVGYPLTFIILAGLNLLALPLVSVIFQLKRIVARSQGG